MDTPLERAANVRLLMLDVDGVLTDGRLQLDARSEEIKTFHVRDGVGVEQLIRNGIQIAVISGRESRAVERHMAQMNVAWVRQSVADKRAAPQEILDMLGLGPRAVAVVGDDTPDLPMFELARLAVAVADAHSSARVAAHYVTQASVGLGTLREVCDLMLEAHGHGAPWSMR